jgi:uncharacterized protein with FMN-binding domain
MAKMGNKMVALCSAAIGAIYMAGYFVTDQPPVMQAVASVPQATTPQTSTPAPDASVAPAQTPSQTPAPSASQATGKYKDGTYTGSGSNRIGTVEVAVTIKNDKITDVQITNCDTHYSQSRIDGLPQQVIERQSADVDIVSGATKSTQDFANAVDEALQQALVNPA